MIRLSQSYLFGAISGTAVIAAAVVFFILFVSAQALRDWPISDLSLGGSDNSTAVSPAQSLGGSSTNAAGENLNGPITGTPAEVAPAAKAGGGGGRHQGSGHAGNGGKVAPETQIQDGRGVDSAPVEQPSSTSPAPAPTTGGGSSPAGTGTASPSPSPAGGNSTGAGQETSSPPSSTGNVGTRTARRVTNTVHEISSAAPPPPPSPVTNTVGEVEARVAPTPPPSGTTVDKVTEAISGIGK